MSMKEYLNMKITQKINMDYDLTDSISKNKIN